MSVPEEQAPEERAGFGDRGAAADGAEGAPFDARTQVEQLLSNGSWLRSLARRLLYDESLADDVLQETWIAALRSPPSKPEALRAWLRSVVRSLSLRANRTLTRRRRLEGKVDPAPPEQATETIAERLETQQRLLAAVQGLRDPYRSVLYLRFYEGLRFVEIAERTNVPSSTVRTQFQRGIDALRDRLSAEYGDSNKWRAALLPLVVPLELVPPVAPVVGDGGAEAATTSTVARSSAGFGAGPIAAAAAVAVLGAAMALSVFTSSRFGPKDAEEVAATRSASVESTSVSLEGPEIVSDERMTSSSADGEARRINEAAEVVALASITDAVTGEPVAGARVYTAPIVEARSRSVGVTDAAGILRGAPGALARDPIFVLAGGYSEYREGQRRRDDATPVTISLQPAPVVKVRVLRDDGQGAPAVPVFVRGRARGLDEREELELTTDQNGVAEYVLRYEDTDVLLEVPGYVTLSLPAQAPEQTLTLRAGARKTLFVRDVDGVPVADCRVEITSDSLVRRLLRTTDDVGVCELAVLAADEEVTLTLSRDDLPVHRVRARPPEADVWSVEMPRGHTVSGSAKNHDGDAAVGAIAFLMVPEARKGEIEAPSRVNTPGLPESRRALRRLVPLERTKVGVEGTFSLGPFVAPESDTFLFLYHPRLLNVLRRVELSKSGRFDVTLGKGVELSGTVRDAQGEPASGVRLHFGEIWNGQFECVIGRARTGVDGSFRFAGLPEPRDIASSTRPLTDDWQDGSDTQNFIVERANDGVLRRTTVFVTSFQPDVIVAMDGSRAEALPSDKGFSLASALQSSASPLQLVTTSAKHGLEIDVQLYDEESVSVRTWARAVAVASDGSVNVGTLGRNTKGGRFFADSSLRFAAEELSFLVVQAEGYRWAVASRPQGAALELTLSSVQAGSVVLELGSGQHAAGVTVFAAFDSDEDSNAVGLRLGTTDSTGRLDISFLPDGSYQLYATGSAVEQAALRIHDALTPLGPMLLSGARGTVRVALPAQSD